MRTLAVPLNRAAAVWPGAAVCVVIALAATFLSDHYGGPQLLYALLLGLSLNFLSTNAAMSQGIGFCSKTALRLGVALLGARITLTQVEGLGLSTGLIVSGAVVLTIFTGLAIAKLMGRPIDEGLLTGTAVAICGASAAMAVAAVLPQTRQNERFALMTVVGVTVLSTLAMVVYPLALNYLTLTPLQQGAFLGGTIHDVAQVVAAGTLLGPEARDASTIVKLYRVALLAPVVLLVALATRRRTLGSRQVRPPFVPPFLAGFLGLVMLGSLGLIGPRCIEASTTASRWLLVSAIAAAGIKTSLSELATLGWKPVAMLVSETTLLAAVVLVLLVVTTA